MPERWIPSLGDYIDVAAFLLGADRTAVQALPRLTLAESALHAPFASFGGVEHDEVLVGPPPNRTELTSRPLGEARCCRRPSPSPVGLWRGGRLVPARCTALAA